jgi:NEDD4-binding protein 2
MEPLGTVYILRGIPGSGKSTIAQTIRRKCGVACGVVSADDYYATPDGGYDFRPEDIGKAHAACYLDALRVVYQMDSLWDTAPQPGASLVVDNTNIEAWEIAPYVSLAQARGYDHLIINRDVPPEIAIARGIHGVPPERVRAMAEAMASTVLPPFWNVTSFEDFCRTTPWYAS